MRAESRRYEACNVARALLAQAWSNRGISVLEVPLCQERDPPEAGSGGLIAGVNGGTDHGEEARNRPAAHGRARGC